MVPLTRDQQLRIHAMELAIKNRPTSTIYDLAVDAKEIYNFLREGSSTPDLFDTGVPHAKSQ